MKKFATPAVGLVAAGLVIAALAGALIATAANDDEDDRDDDRIALESNEGTPADAPATAPTPATSSTDVDGADGVVVDADDIALTQREADRATKAAIAAVGGGTVSELSRSDDRGEAFEVEVQTSTGEVDVALDVDFNRVSNNPYDD